MQFGEGSQPVLSNMTETILSQLHADVSAHKLRPLYQIELVNT